MVGPEVWRMWGGYINPSDLAFDIAKPVGITTYRFTCYIDSDGSCTVEQWPTQEVRDRWMNEAIECLGWERQ